MPSFWCDTQTPRLALSALVAAPLGAHRATNRLSLALSCEAVWVSAYDPMMASRWIRLWLSSLTLSAAAAISATR